ncbi:Ribosome-releasing factor 2, mitochondrial [Chytridiales sp. JEL 0842]|nr:Ribosome-releasing factor 2, mitochondrial [Chytridiales sp. JEL 0842]
MLYYAGYTQRIGDVDSGSTVTDYLPAERERGITITSACIPLLWKHHRLNLIDTPGHVDFTIEVERSVRVLDGTVVILDGVAGVEAQTETVWKQANRNKIPRIAFVNKMDREGAGLMKCVNSMERRLKGWGSPLVVQWPVVLDGTSRVNGPGSGGPGFEGVVDLLEMQILDWKTNETGSIVRKVDFTTKPTEGSNPELERLWNDAVNARTTLVETMSSLDDAVVEAFLEKDGDHMAVEASILKASLRRLTLSGKAIPVLCGAAFRNAGVQPVLDAVIDYLPSPRERPHPVGTLPDGKKVDIDIDDKKLCALAFKVIHDPKRGALVFVRVYSGAIDNRMALYNSTLNVRERAGKLLQMYADDYEEIPRITAGNIACIVGLNETKTGDTLLSMTDVPTKKQISTTATVLDTIPIPPPVFVRSVEPITSADDRKLSSALASLIREDPSLVVTIDPESGQTLLGGMGELHLEIASERLQDTHKCAAKMGKVTISYRETVDPNAGILEGSYLYDKEIFGRRVKVEVGLRVCAKVDPRETEDGLVDASKGVEMNEIVVDVDPALVFPVAAATSAPTTNSSNGHGVSKTKTTSRQVQSPSGYPKYNEILQALHDGLQTSLNRGPILGVPLANVHITCTSLKLFAPDLTTLGAIRAATSRCVFNILSPPSSSSSFSKKPFGPTRLLEPVMNLTITLPEKHLGTVTKDLTGSTRRGQILSLSTSTDQQQQEGEEKEDCGGYESHVVEAMVPLGSLVGYSTLLRGLTAGTGDFAMRLRGYGLMPTDREEQVVKEIRGY